MEDNSKNIENKIGIPNVPTVPLLQTNQLKVVAEDTGLKRVDPMQCCGGCGKFHLASCGFPNGYFETLPEDWYAGGMRCFIPKQPEMPSFDDKVGEGV